MKSILTEEQIKKNCNRKERREHKRIRSFLCDLCVLCGSISGYRIFQTALALCLLASALAGCAVNPAVDAAKAGMKTVRLDPHIDSRQGMRYGADLGGGGLANVLAASMLDSALQKAIARMSGVMQSNDIIVADLVRASVQKRLHEDPGLNVVDGEADGTFVVTIMQFGFDNPGLQFSRKIPIIFLRAQLVDRTGKKVWSRQNGIDQLASKGMGATWDQYAADPKKLRADWEAQIDNIVAKLIPVK
jgi:hypothetical protein